MKSLKLIFIVTIIFSLNVFSQDNDEAQLLKCQNFIKRGLQDSSIMILNKIISRDSTIYKALVLRGICYGSLGENSLALRDFNKAVEFNSSDADVYFNRALLNQKLGNIEFAIKDYNEAIKNNPNKAVFYFNKAFIYDDIGKYNESIKNYSKAILLDSLNSDYYNNRAIAYKNINEYKFALADYNKAIEFNPKNSMAYFNRAKINVIIGNQFDACLDLNHSSFSGNSQADLIFNKHCTNYYNDLIDYIRKETVNGILDFEKYIDNKPLFVIDNIAYNKDEYILYLWGKKINILGVKSLEKLIKIYESIYNITLSQNQIDALSAGFNSNI